MTATSERFRRVAAAFTERVDAVPADRWDNPSPCDEWTARDVVRHLVGNAELFLGLVGHELPTGPSTDDDPACVPKVEAPAGADEQTRLLAFMGRRVERWVPDRRAGVVSRGADDLGVP